MKKITLLFSLVLWLSSVQAQMKDYRVKGLQAALRDSSEFIVKTALQELKFKNVLDSLFVRHALPASVPGLLRNGPNPDPNAGLKIYLLSCQNPIPKNDLDEINNYLFSDKQRVTSNLNDISPRAFNDPGFAITFKRLYQVADNPTRNQLLRMRFAQHYFTEPELQSLAALLKISYGEYRGDHFPATQEEQDEGEKILPSEYNGDLTDTFAELLSPGDRLSIRVDFLRKLIARSDQAQLERIFEFVSRAYADHVVAAPFLPVHQQLAARLKHPLPPGFFVAVLRLDTTTGKNYKELSSWLDQVDCDGKSRIITQLLRNKKFAYNRAEVLLKYLNETTCTSKLNGFQELENNTLDVPLLLNILKNIKNPDAKTRIGLAYLLLSCTDFSEQDRPAVEKLISSFNDKDLNYFFFLFSRGYISPVAFDIFRARLKSASPSVAGEIVTFLLRQQRYGAADMQLFTDSLYGTRTSRQLISAIKDALVARAPRQKEADTLLVNYLDRHHGWKDITNDMIRQGHVDQIFWPYVIRDGRDDENLLEKVSYFADSVPKKYGFDLVNDAVNSDRSQFEQHRYQAYVLGQGSRDVVMLLKWVAKPGNNQPVIEKMDFAEKRQVLAYFDSIWNKLDSCQYLKDELAVQVNAIVRSMSNREIGKVDGIVLNFEKRFAEDPLLKDKAPALKEMANGALGVVPQILGFIDAYGYVLLVHPFFWLMLLLLYRKNKKVQSLFFWNPSVRKWLGLGYVNLLLIYVPGLRRIILKPFEQGLLEDARLGEFDPEAYFKEIELKYEQSGEPLDLHAVSHLRGQTLIHGDSGLGKTMILCHILKQSQETAVFLRAEVCNQGVEAAIVSKMKGIAREDSFIQSVLFNGSIDIFIDGVNEVGPETRVLISTFLGDYPHCRCFIASQPIEWNFPAKVVVIDLLPLSAEHISRFLTGRFSGGVKGKIDKETYDARCESFLKDAIGEETAPLIKALNLQTLSNPFDLTIVSQLIINSPAVPLNLLGLQEEYYSQMISRYSEIYKHKGPFPIELFSERLFELRLVDNRVLPFEDFHDEIDCMQEFKMVFNRVAERNKEEWFFRHDKIREYFLLQSFLAHPERQKKFIKDPRFRGVYFLLATNLPLAEARSLERILIDYSVDNNDFKLSSEFIKLLRVRTNTVKKKD